MNITVPSMQDLLSAGVHFGHKVSRGHPKMGQFIFGAREGVHIIDLAKSEEKLKEAAEKAYEIGNLGKVMLIVGTKKQARDIVADLAKEADIPFLNIRWVGGLFTNFEEVKKNIKKLASLKEEQQKGELTRYTKKEQLLFSRKLSKFSNELGGVVNMDKLPDAVFLIDPVADNIAVKESQRMNVTIFGLSDTNADPNWLDYPIPANDDGIKSIKIISETIIKAYAAGKKEAGIKLEKAKAAEEKATKAAELDQAVAEEAEALEEQVEKKIVAESERKVE